jgi:hypothetical protein
MDPEDFFVKQQKKEDRPLGERKPDIWRNKTSLKLNLLAFQIGFTNLCMTFRAEKVSSDVSEMADKLSSAVGEYAFQVTADLTTGVNTVVSILESGVDKIDRVQVQMLMAKSPSQPLGWTPHAAVTEPSYVSLQQKVQTTLSNAFHALRNIIIQTSERVFKAAVEATRANWWSEGALS